MSSVSLDFTVLSNVNPYVPTSGLVDSNGRLLVSADVGLYGNNIRAAI